VSASDTLGIFNVQGYDGAAYLTAAQIVCALPASPAPATNVMPGELSFWTNAGAANSTERMRLTATGRLGIATTNPLGPFHVVDSANTVAYFDEYASAGNASAYFRAARGTSSVPAAIGASDVLMQLIVQGHDGTTFRNAGVFRYNAAGAATASGVPSYCDIFVGSGSANVLAARFLKSQHVMLTGTAAPADADLLNSCFAFWIDPNTSTPKINIKAKDSAGSIRTAVITLT